MPQEPRTRMVAIDGTPSMLSLDESLRERVTAALRLAKQAAALHEEGRSGLAGTLLRIADLLGALADDLAPAPEPRSPSPAVRPLRRGRSPGHWLSRDSRWTFWNGGACGWLAYLDDPDVAGDPLSWRGAATLPTLESAVAWAEGPGREMAERPAEPPRPSAPERERWDRFVDDLRAQFGGASDG